MELTNPQAVLSIHPLGPHLERRPSDTQELPVDAFDRNISDMIISAASSEELPQMTRRKNETTGQTKEKERTHRDSSGLVAARVSRRLDRYSLDGVRQPQISNVRSPCKWKDKKLKECWPNCVSNQFFFFLHDCEADGVYEFFTLVETVISVGSVYERKSEKFDNR